MDAFLRSFKDLSNELLPILGAIVLVCLIVLLIRLIKVAKSVDNTINKTHKTIDLVDETMEKVQTPLDTVVKVSKTVDKAHDKTIEVYEKGKDFVVKNAEGIKNKVVSLVSDDKKEELQEQNPEDKLGE